MRKRVLVAEESDTNRRIAETVLRQNGFEVVSVSSADKAKEVLQFARPDLIIVGGDLKTADGQPYFERLTENPKTASIPLMLFDSAEQADLPFPPEVIIPSPFDPQEFVQRVTAFTGQGAAASPPNPLSQMHADDEFLDAALGLDRIDVTDSEVLDRTSMPGKGIPIGKNSERLVGFDHVENDTEDLSDSSRVESVMMRDEKAEKKRPAPPASTQTSKLEIMEDQYGLSDPGAFKEQNNELNHDYDWFINSMREEVGEQGPKPAQPAQTKLTESARIRTITKPVPAENPFADLTDQSSAAQQGGGKRRNAGVDKFIDEFKKEIERIKTSESESIFIEETHKDSGGSDQGLAWEETLEKVSPEQVEIFTRQLASELAEKIAAKIAAKIDPDRLMQLIKSEILAHYKNQLR